MSKVEKVGYGMDQTRASTRSYDTSRSHPAIDLVLPATPTPDPGWVLAEDGFHLAREHEIESLFAVANGYVGSRGSLAEGSSLSAPATFIAGVFDTLPHSQVPEL